MSIEAWAYVCFASNHSKAYIHPRWPNRSLTTRLRLALSLDVAVRTLRMPEGLYWNSLGVAFASDWDFASPFMKSVLQPLLGATSTYSQPVLQFDHVEHRALPRDEDDVDGLRALLRDGFVRIDSSWAIAPLLTPSLRRGISRKLLNRSRHQRASNGLEDGGELASTVHELPELSEALLPHLLPRLKRLAAAYLGDDAELTLYEGSEAIALRVPSRFADSWPVTYPSGNWHHDRCGNRLKAFIFLQRVTLHTHPTRRACRLR